MTGHPELDELPELLGKLRNLSPGALFRLLFSQQGSVPPPALEPAELDRLRGILSRQRERLTRRTILTMIYGVDAAPLVTALAHFKPPSSEKRAFVDKLLELHGDVCPWADGRTAPPRLRWRKYKEPAEFYEFDTNTGEVTSETREGGWNRSRPRRGWLTSQLLHAYAFRPEAFNSRAEPLYRRCTIKQAGKERVLHVPNQYLRSVQDALLLYAKDAYVPALPAWISGFGAGTALPTIFDNAKAHARRDLIASFDLKDFFPSVGVGEIARGLVQAGGQLGTPDAADARVLLSRLATRRGRLPQGSPTSPLLAALAFWPFDERIRKLLGPDVTYTRYFDDITVSLTKRQADRLARSVARPRDGRDRSRRIPRLGRRPPDVRTPSGFRKFAEAAITDALDGTRFRLNGRKSRAGSTLSETGFEITGITVSRNGFTLGRRKRRKLRSICHTVVKHGFNRAAEQTVSAETVDGLTPTVQRRRSGLLDRGHQIPGRRATLERLTIAVLPTLLGNYQALSEPLDRVDESPSEDSQLSARELEQVLFHIYSGGVAVERSDTGVAVRGFPDADVRIQVERNANFFLLPREAAARVVMLVHRLSGMRAFLTSAPKGEAFASFHDMAQAIADALAGGQVTPPDSPKGRRTRSPEKLPSLTGHGILREQVDAVIFSLTDFARRSGRPMPPVSESDRGALASAAPDANALARWLRQLLGLLRELPLLPEPQVEPPRSGTFHSGSIPLLLQLAEYPTRSGSM